MSDETLYLCDKKKECNKSLSCINGLCMYTTDPNHAIKEPEFEIDIRKWLRSFNTDSAPQCFNAVQELKKRLEDIKMTDMVNHPPHYEGKIESIEAMEEVVGKSGVFDFCICNAFKYIWRCKKKHDTPIEDLKKAVWYLNHAIDIYEEEPAIKELYFDNQKVTIEEAKND